MVLLLNRMLQVLKRMKLNTGGNVQGSMFKEENVDLYVHHEYSSENTGTNTERWRIKIR